MAKKTTKKKTTKKTAKKTTRAAATRGKKVAKKTTTKKTTKKTTAARTAAPKITSAVKARTKSEIYSTISEHVGVTKKEVAAVFDTMTAMMAADLKKGKAEQFNVPGLMKVVVQRKPATKARKAINPFTGEPTIFKAKPARNVVKVRPMKGLKDLV